MDDAQIKHMVDRFLSWRLPEYFAPDAGISFQKTFNEHTAHPMKHQPTGTNLFDADQAEAMVRYMAEGMPLAAYESAKQREARDRRSDVAKDAKIERLWGELSRALLPCPICKGIEGCDHTIPERAAAHARSGRVRVFPL